MKEFEHLVDALISLNIRNRKLIPKGSLDPIQYLIEHETVQVNIGRASGKTEYILSHIKHGDLLVTYSQPSARMLSEKLGFNKNIKIVYTEYDLHSNTENPSFRTMYIDEPRLCFRNIRKERLYNYFYNDSIEGQLILMLGE